MRLKKLILSLCLLTLVTSSLVAGAAARKNVLERFPAPQENFQQHIEEVRNYLLDTQLTQRKPTDVFYNLPFELSANEAVPYRGKYLLIHGLNDSPSVWHDTAAALVERGFDVRAILLPGHGNTPKAQLDVSYKQWLNAARMQLTLWSTPDVPLYIGGFSMGGVIATILALENDGVDGLLLFAPAYRSTKDHLLRWASLVSRFKPWVFGGMIIEDNPARYNSIPINATAQYYKVTRHLHRKWHRRKLEIPVLMVATLDDSVVRVDNVRAVFQRRFTSTRRRLVLYTNTDEAPKEHEIIKPSYYPDLRMLNQAHMSMNISPENSLYGKEGRQLVCNGNEWAVFSACLYYRGGPHWHGAAGTVSPDGVPVARTTYNPDFEAIMTLHDEVFAADVD